MMFINEWMSKWMKDTNIDIVRDTKQTVLMCECIHN